MGLWLAYKSLFEALMNHQHMNLKIELYKLGLISLCEGNNILSFGCRFCFWFTCFTLATRASLSMSLRVYSILRHLSYFPIDHHNHEPIASPETDCAKMFGQRSTKSDLAEGSSEPGRGQKRLRDSQGLNKIEDNVGDEDEPGELHRNKLAKTLAELSAAYNSSGIKRAHANRRYVISFEAI